MNAEDVVRTKLEELGFSKASKKLRDKSDKKRKLMIAYEHFRYVRKEKIEAFNKKLKDETKEKTNSSLGFYTWKELSFTRVEDYEEIPPDHVLEKMSEAKDKKCFDHFEVAHIVAVKDPILFGRVKGCSDRFYIDQWDDDVKIEDILMPNEG